MMQKFLDITGIVLALSELGRPVVEIQRTTLRALDWNIGLSLLLSPNIKKLAEETTWYPLRAFAADNFLLALEPHGDIADTLYSLKPPFVLWCNKTENEAQGLVSATEIDLIVDTDTIKQTLSIAKEIVNSQFVLTLPRTEQVKQASKLGFNGIAFKITPQSDLDNLDEASSYAAKLNLELCLVVDYANFSKELLERLDPEVAIFASSFIATVMGSAVEALADKLKQIGKLHS